MPVIAPWLTPPNFIGAAEAGARLGLSRQQMLEQAQEHADSLAAAAALQRDRQAQDVAERNQQQHQFDAAQSLREAALKQAGLLGEGRLDTEAEAIKQRQDAADAANSLRKQRMDLDNQNQVLNNERAYKLATDRIQAPLINKDRMTVRQVLNPAYVLGGKEPAYLSLTNRMTGAIPPMPLTEPDDSGMSAGESLSAPTAESVDGLDQIPSAQASEIPTVNSQDEYDALSPGEKYLDSNGKLATKKGQ